MGADDVRRLPSGLVVRIRLAVIAVLQAEEGRSLRESRPDLQGLRHAGQSVRSRRDAVAAWPELPRHGRRDRHRVFLARRDRELRLPQRLGEPASGGAAFPPACSLQPAAARRLSRTNTEAGISSPRPNGVRLAGVNTLTVPWRSGWRTSITSRTMYSAACLLCRGCTSGEILQDIQAGEVIRHLDLAVGVRQLAPVGRAERGGPDAPVRPNVRRHEFDPQRTPLPGGPHQAGERHRQFLMLDGHHVLACAAGQVVGLEQLRLVEPFRRSPGPRRSATRSASRREPVSVRPSAR